MLCALADGLEALTGRAPRRRVDPDRRRGPVRGGAQDRAGGLRLPGRGPRPGEYVADGAARQAAGVLLGDWPRWDDAGSATVSAPADPGILERYRSAAATAWPAGAGSRNHKRGGYRVEAIAASARAGTFGTVFT